jgi:hypothetical protein
MTPPINPHHLESVCWLLHCISIAQMKFILIIASKNGRSQVLIWLCTAHTSSQSLNHTVPMCSLEKTGRVWWLCDSISSSKSVQMGWTPTQGPVITINAQCLCGTLWDLRTPSRANIPECPQGVYFVMRLHVVFWPVLLITHKRSGPSPKQPELPCVWPP